MAMLPMAMYGLEVPAGDVAITARPDIPSAFRITMAAIDPSAEPEGDEGAIPRATLKVIRQSLVDDDDEESDFDQDEMERMLAEEYSDESDEDEDVNGGPSDPQKSKKARIEQAKKDVAKLLSEQDVDGMDVDEDVKTNGINGAVKSPKAKGKMPASDEDESESDEDDDSSFEGGEIEEYVICTLDPSKLYQQPLDITFGEDERVWFKVSGTHSIFLTGNYVEPLNDPQGMFDPDSDEEMDYDMEPDEDELELEDSEDESIDDGLDDLADPRITEVDEAGEEVAPVLVNGKNKKSENKITALNKNKRPAPESADEDEAEGGAEGLDEMIAKEAKIAEAAAPAIDGEQKLSKKQLKKLKKNNGVAGAAPVTEPVIEKKEVEAPASNKSDKKVSFAKELEQGPTPSKSQPTADKAADKDKPKGPSLGPKTIQGVTVDDKKLGTGQAAKSGDRVSMRYIGKLKDGKIFDSNKKGKPFSFKLGSGEVIKGWDIGVQGMQVGGERRITIPAHLAYGSKKTGEIPPNSALVFDIKVLEINKK